MHIVTMQPQLLCFCAHRFQLNFLHSHDTCHQKGGWSLRHHYSWRLSQSKQHPPNWRLQSTTLHNSVVWLLHQLQARHYLPRTSAKSLVIRNHDVIHDTKFPVRYGAMCPGAPNRTVEGHPFVRRQTFCNSQQSIGI